MGRWAVVGGGILGSTVAWRLARAGNQVTLYEAAPELGGLASAWSLGPIVWDRHYHVTLLSDSHTRGLLEELGLEDEMRWVETRTGSHFEQNLYSISNTFEYLRYPPLSLLDKARLAWTILYGARVRNWQRLEGKPVESWLRYHSGNKVFDRFWLPLLEAKLGEAYRETSAAFIWATIQRLYAARRTGLKKEMFGYVPGGYARVLARLADRVVEAGVELQLNSRVEKVSPGPVVMADGISRQYDRVVITTAAPIAARMISGMESQERARLEEVRYQGIVCPSVLLTRPLSPYYLTYLHDPAPFTGIIEMSAFVDPVEFGGKTLVYLPKYCDPSDPVFEESDESIKERFLTALNEIHPSFSADDVLAFRVSRVRYVFPIPTLNYSEKAPAFDTSVQGVHLLGSAQIINGTLNVNDTLQLAERGLDHLLAFPARLGAA